VAEADLRGLGLTTGRVAALQALARAVARGALDFGAPAEEVVGALAALPGFGHWTAEYVALRALGAPDAFPAPDLVLRRAAAGGGPALTAAALASRATAWRPWRGYAALHLWCAAADARSAAVRPRGRSGRPARPAGVDSAADRGAGPLAGHDRHRLRHQQAIGAR
jgi:AraC family transcriptional regulator of adaptative response / DNA-3-methyladenine glycosylase II